MNYWIAQPECIWHGVLKRVKVKMYLCVLLSTALWWRVWSHLFRTRLRTGRRPLTSWTRIMPKVQIPNHGPKKKKNRLHFTWKSVHQHHHLSVFPWSTRSLLWGKLSESGLTFYKIQCHLTSFENKKILLWSSLHTVAFKCVFTLI